MTFNDVLKNAYLISALFIISSFNSILLVNIQAYNILNILILIVIVSHIALRLTEDIGKPPAYDLLMLLFIFFAGINIQSKEKLFLFLFLAYSLHSAYYFLEPKSLSRTTLIAMRITAVVSSLTSLAFLILLEVHQTRLLFLAIAVILLLIGQIIMVILKIKKYSDIQSTIEKHLSRTENEHAD